MPYTTNSGITEDSVRCQSYASQCEGTLPQKVLCFSKLTTLHLVEILVQEASGVHMAPTDSAAWWIRVGPVEEGSPHKYKIIHIVGSFRLHYVFLAERSILREMGVIQPIIVGPRLVSYNAV